MPKCTNRDCGSMNVFRVNPGEKIPQWKCLTCKIFFIEQKDRIDLLKVINKDFTDLRIIDNHGVINKRVVEFWKRTFPASRPYFDALEEAIPNIWEILTATTTIDRDARRDFDGNDEGLNQTYRKEEKPSIKANLLIEQQ